MNFTGRENRLDRFYGDVAREQNRDILRLVTGKILLDIGCGYGNLIYQAGRELPNADIKGIDVDPESIRIAKARYGIDVKDASVYNTGFPESAFDTVFLRDTIHHLAGEGRLDEALKEIYRICGKEFIIFDPNPNWIVKISRFLIRHKDPEMPFGAVVASLEACGFKVERCAFRDVIAFPLSGGFVGMELVPNMAFLKRFVLMLDNILKMSLKALRLERYFCWRYLIYTTKVRKI